MIRFRECQSYFRRTSKNSKRIFRIQEEPVIVLLVHEAPNNPCSERWALKDWFLDNGYILEEYDQKNFEEEYYESND